MSARWSIPVMASGRVQRGATLMEFMIAMALGLVLVLAASSIFLAQTASFSTQGDVSATRDVTRQAAIHLSRQLRLAGFRMIGESPKATFDALSTANGIDANGSDRIVVSYFGSGTGAGDGAVLDCLGQSVNGTTRVTIHYAVRTVGRITGIYCSQDDGVNWSLLFPGIESMQLLHGIDVDDDGSIDSLAPAPTVITATATTVRSIELSFIVSSPSANNMRTGTDEIAHFGANYTPDATDSAAIYSVPNDGRVRMHERVTVALRNRLD